MQKIPDLSIYALAKDITSKDTIPIDMFLDRVHDGYWQDIVLPIQAIADKEQRNELKRKTAPGVTIAGSFDKRADNALIKHSGFIAVDLDDLEDINETKSIICPDPHVYACFTSISGRGLCVLFKINPAKHRESYRGIAEYLYNTYDIVVVSTGINLSRLRFVSFDPDLYRNEGAIKWTKYPKEKAPRKVEKIVFAQNDFEEILKEIGSRGLNLCENYHEWLRIGFAFADRFGESGRSYFHQVSQYSSKYNPQTCNKQYDNCLRGHGSAKTTIATFYYYCKQAGLSLYSERTKTIAYSAAQGKKGGLNAQQVTKNLAQFEQIEGQDVQQIVDEVMNNNVELHEDGLIEQLEIWLRQNFNLRRNEVTRYIEDGSKKLEDKDLNTIWIGASKVFDKVSFETLNRLINSDFVPDYNPFKEFIRDNEERGKKGGAIEALFSSIRTTDPEYLQYFGKKWIVSIMSAINKKHSPLMLVLCGEQSNGKTEFFRRLLPDDLQPYYAESKLDEGKDADILMTKKLIVMDDEMGGKSKAESKRLKDMTSKQIFTVREPYGRTSVDLIRLAVLCGTTNHNEILNDPTGNRRIIPIRVLEIDYNAYNAVDKTELFMEAYHLWKSGFDWQVISKEDREYLATHNDEFEEPVLEEELLLKYFEKGDEPKMASEILTKIEDLSGKKNLILKRLGMGLTKFGFDKKRARVGGESRSCWMVHERDLSLYGGQSNNKDEEDPFPKYETKPQSPQPVQQELKFNPQNNYRNEFF